MLSSWRTQLLITRIALYVASALIVVWSVAPFLWQVSTSFQEDRLLSAPTPSFLPWPGTLDHFRNIFVEKEFHLYIVNSAIVAGLTTLFCLAIGGAAAFALARLRVYYRFGILALILSVSMFPQIAIVAPLYLAASALGLMNTYTILVIIYLSLGLPLVIWVLFGYFQTIPREIDEAAIIDGAGPLRLMISVILPMSLPGFVTTGLLAFIMAWNEFMFALAFTSGVDRQTIPVGIANFTNLYYVPWGDLAAASVVVTLPLVLLVLGFQRWIIQGLTQGAVKE
ncbi:sugar ABC transporter permease [Pleomorphomonas diazotrophica]|uniref:Sugar ABC transporter permease n=1 Tax=Pleomorphomonas diazotrophica TaxID=1166257 RepID=A0A1I4TPH0_9HYPH|nr:carbohydrate ABC transporter permease [Pleomorphomonas diazotrophica]PKR87587.1 sugar ABC transporter permease [Pleomorphomonas diazotrophica]SFM78589.1 carbohydrate ABC transporter membrane protein 2, CUT1 family [Pleomorphomonas diazotrophica]